MAKTSRAPHRRVYAIPAAKVQMGQLDVACILLVQKLYGGLTRETDRFFIQTSSVRAFVLELLRPTRDYGHHHLEVLLPNEDEVIVQAEVAWGLAWVWDVVSRKKIEVFQECTVCKVLFEPDATEWTRCDGCRARR